MLVPVFNLTDIFINLTNKYGMQYWDYTLDSLNNHKEYFYNATHLNIRGAEIFSEYLAKDLVNLIKKNKDAALDSRTNRVTGKFVKQ